ncbi:MSP domain protein [Ostertagia ostertagi]
MKTTATTTTTATAANKSVLKTVVSELPPEENIVDALGEGEKLVVDAASKDAMSVNLKVEPPKATFKSTGGLSNHTLTNKSKARLVFKIKCSNNNEYGIHPVYGFIEPMASTIIMITRLPGNPKEDKAVIQWVEATADAKDPKEAFKNASPWSTQSIKVALVVVGDTPAAPKEKSAILPIKPAPAAIKSPVPMPGAPALQPPAPPIAPIKPIGFQKPVSPAPTTPFKPATVPAQKPLPTGPTTPPKPGVTIPAPAFPKAPVSRPTFGPAAPSTPMSSKRPSGAIIPLQPPAISRFPVPGGPPPPPAKGTSDLPVVSVYAVGGVGGGGPKSMVMPGVMAASPTSKPPK